jgi:hypothetical protein
MTPLRYIVAAVLALLVAKPLLKFGTSLRGGLRTTLFVLLGVGAGVLVAFLALTLGTWSIRMLVPVLLAVLATRSLLTFDVARKRTEHPGDVAPEGRRPMLRKRTRGMLQLGVGFGVAYVIYRFGAKPHFDLDLAIAVGVGYATHLFGDVCMNGVPLLWPAMPSLSRRVTLSKIETDGPADHVIGWVVLALTIGLFALTTSGVVSAPHLLHSFA